MYLLLSPDNASWRAGEKIGLWNLQFMRKPSYSGFADGLAGK
jgi:endo-1,4-beta-xylanase